MPEHDYSEFKEEDKGPGDNLLKALTNAADNQEGVEKEIEDLTEKLRLAKERLKNISEFDIPNLMEGLKGSIELPDGRTVTIKEDIRCSLPSVKTSPEKHFAAIKILDDSDHAAILKRQFTIEFAKDEDKWADKFESDMAKRKKPLNVKRTKTVHPQTLKAFIKECMAKGVDFPMETFSVYRQRVAKIK